MDLNKIAEELFAKIRGRFPGVTIGDEEGNVTTEPAEARYFEFPFKEAKGDKEKTKVSISLGDEDGVTVMYNSAVAEDEMSKNKWYSFLRELRTFSKKRMLNFDVRNITKSNLEKRDYQYLAKNSGDDSMNESKLYGTSKLSYQDMDGARIVIKHNESVNTEIPSGRTRNIGAIYIESPEGERFKYPFKHLAGARAMARHVAEGGTTYDDFGSHIVDLSEEMSKLRKFKNYMGRSSVMAESLAGYLDVVHERIGTVKKRIDSLQKKNYYQEAFNSFEKPVFEEIPEDVKDNWIDQLTIRQFNEELKDVFPYIYKLVGEATRARELGPDDFVNEDGDPCWDGYEQQGMKDKDGKKVPNCVPESDDVEEGIGRKFNKIMNWGMTNPEELKKRVRDMSDENLKKLAGSIKDTKAGSGSERALQIKLINQELKRRYGVKPSKDPIESMFNELMGQWNEEEDESCCAGCEAGTGCENDDEEVTEIAKDDLVNKINNAIGGDLEKYLGKPGQRETELENNIVRYQDVRKSLQKELSDPSPDRGMIDEYREIKEKLGNNIKNIIGKIKKGEYKPEPRAEGNDNEDGGKSPLTEFILSFYDRANGSFPKGETAVLTMVEKDYGEQFIEPAKQFIEKVNHTFEQYNSSSHTIEEDDNTGTHGFFNEEKGPNNWPGIALRVYSPHPRAMGGFTTDLVNFWGSMEMVKKGDDGMNGVTLDDIKAKGIQIHGSSKEALEAAKAEAGAGSQDNEEFEQYNSRGREVNTLEAGGDQVHGFITSEKGPNNHPGVAIRVLEPHPTALGGFTRSVYDFWGSMEQYQAGEKGMNGKTKADVEAAGIMVHDSSREAIQAAQGEAPSQDNEEFNRIRQLAGL